MSVPRCVCLALCIAAAAEAQSISVEPPAYWPGDLITSSTVSQDGWKCCKVGTDFTGYAADNTVFSPMDGSTMSIKVAGPGGSRVYRSLPSAISTGVFQISYDFMYSGRAPGSTTSLRMNQVFYDSATNQAFQIDIFSADPTTAASQGLFADPDGLGGVGYGSVYSLFGANPIIQPNVWHRITFIVDFDQHILMEFRTYDISTGSAVLTGSNPGVWYINNNGTSFFSWADFSLRLDPALASEGYWFDNLIVSEIIPPAPQIETVTPNPDAAWVDIQYTRQLTLLNGGPNVTWSVAEGPTGLQVNSSGLVSGWVPSADQFEQSIPITIQATNRGGSDTASWLVHVYGFCDPAGWTSLDCNDNGIADRCDIRDGTSHDCNGNGIPDECDLVSGASKDCNGNTIPDECELEIAADSVLEFSGTQGRHNWYYGYYNTPGDSSTWALMSVYDLAPFCTPCGPWWAVTSSHPPWGVLYATGGVPGADDYGPSQWAVRRWVATVTGRIRISGDLAKDADPSGDGIIGYILVDGQIIWSQTIAFDDFIGVHFDVDASVSAGSTVDFAISPGDAPHIPGDWTRFTATISNPSGTLTDCDHNGVPDVCDLQVTPDCNGNGILDRCDILSGTSLDCNTNGVPDECDLSSDASTDANANGVPDECDPDCNGNGVPDDLDLARGTSQDCNHNGILDDCEQSLVYVQDFESAPGPEWDYQGEVDVTPSGRRFLGQFTTYDVVLTLDNLPPHGSLTVSFDLFLILSWDGNLLPGGPDIWDLSVVNGPTLLHTTFMTFNPEGHPDYRQAYPGNYPGGDHPALTGATEVNTLGYVDGAPLDAVYRLTCTLPHTGNSVKIRFSGSNLTDESWGLDNVAVQVSMPDCNHNGVLDVCDLAQGTSQDCDSNGVPDECDVAVPDRDCNHNDVPDACDITAGTEQDCNMNGVPDSCDFNRGVLHDCNSNSAPDECELGVVALADSEADFSATQALNNWYYGFYATEADPASWTLMLLYDVENQWWEEHPTQPNWGLLNSAGGVPGTYTGHPAHWAVRRWVSGVTGPIRATGDLRKQEGAAGGDGMEGYILVNGEVRWSHALSFDDVVGINYSVDLTVQSGAAVDFALSPGSDRNIDSDWGIFTANIQSMPGAFVDCDGNSLPDTCDLQSTPDCNGNGVLDRCDIRSGASADCNENSIPDECDIASSGGDCNGNGLLDQCEVDNGQRSAIGWGNNNYGQANAPAGTDYLAIAAGPDHSLALKSPGSLLTWGRSDWGLGTVPTGSNYVAVAAGYAHSIALKSNGSLVGWGRNDFGQASVPTGNGYAAIAAGNYHNLALKADGSIVGWGRNVVGELNVPSGNNYIAVAAGGEHSLALKSDGSIVGWGNNQFGQINVPPGTNFIAIAAGGSHGLALRSDGSIVGWGRNSEGQINTPGGSGYTAIAAGGGHSLALKRDRSMIGWGGRGGPETIPPAGKTFTAVAAGNSYSLAVYLPPTSSTAPDCNQNGLPDECDIASGVSHDCNGNGIPDSCDISTSMSTDVNSDGIPDECEPDVRIMPVVTLVDPYMSSEVRAALPGSATAVVRGSTYYVEIWGSDLGAANTGLTGVYVDVAFCTQTTAASVEHGDTFITFSSGTAQPGKVDEFGGSALPSGGGIAPQWVRIGWIQMAASVDISTCSISFQPSASGVAALNRGLIPWTFVQLGTASIQIQPPAKSYDLDGNGTINVGDLSLFAGSWLGMVPPGATAHDFDCDNHVGVGDLSWFATGWMKAADDPTILYPPCGDGGAPAPAALPAGPAPNERDATSELPDVDFELVVLTAQSTINTLTSLPTSVVALAPGQVFWAEVWASDVGSVNTGLTSAYVDLGYPAGPVTVLNVSHGGIFTVFPTGTAGGGRVDELGGSALPGGVGIASQWVRVAAVRMRVDAAAPAFVFNLSASATGVAALARGAIPWDSISLDSVLIGEPIAADFDGDIDVDTQDLVVFLGCVSGPSVPRASNNACIKADFDEDGDVDMNDFGVFQRCYGGEGQVVNLD